MFRSGLALLFLGACSSSDPSQASKLPIEGEDGAPTLLVAELSCGCCTDSELYVTLEMSPPIDSAAEVTLYLSRDVEGDTVDLQLKSTEQHGRVSWSIGSFGEDNGTTELWTQCTELEDNEELADEWPLGIRAVSTESGTVTAADVLATVKARGPG